jgi:TonB-dependent SusC/RagA subfamily outer membrane receptor
MNARKSVGWLLVLFLTLALPSVALAQGTVTGRVTQSSSLRPLAGAQVSIPGSAIGSLANNEGIFRIQNVPVGTHTVRVEILGFATQERSVTVANGQTVTADFSLEQQALGLDEIVVTGTAGGQQRRAIGNVVGSLSASSTLEQSTPASLQQMLAGRVPGVSINVGGGNVGTGGPLEIRGISTISLGGGPLIYVDGVRFNGSGGRLNDLNPEDIDRIEVIKGPAAATLYGTEASNGVVQIITKKGTAGARTVELVVRQGANWFNDPGGRIEPNFGLVNGQIISQDLYAEETAAGRAMFRTGQIQNYGLSIRGGRDNFSYYVSGNHDDEQGYMLNNGAKKTTLRTNLQLAATSELDVSTDVGVTRASASTQPDGTSGTTGIFSMLLWGNPLTRATPSRGFMVGPPEVNYDIDTQEQTNRATASVTITHRPLSWLTQKLVTGVDWTDEKSSTFHPRLPEGSPAFYGANSTGRKVLSNARTLNQTVDYNVTAMRDVNADISSATSFGAQFFTRETASGTADGQQMPTPAVSTVSAAAVRTGSESFSENKTFGVFVQQTFGWRNQAFLTGALRADANSAFGESFDAAYYPKLSGTWVVSDAAFWNVGFVENLKLRAAWGRSGLQPSAFAKFRTYSPITGPGDLPAVTPGNVGNPDLKPEVGQELELGFDAGLFSNRVIVEFTHYRQMTTDVILSERVAPSLGFAGDRDVNAGKVSNQGYELRLETTPIQTRSISLNIGGAVAYTKNKLEDLEGRRVQADTRGRWQHIEGLPLGAMHTKYIASAAWGPNRTLINVMCKGPAPEFTPMPCAQAPFHFFGRPDPGITGSVSNLLSIGNAVTISALWMFVGDSRRFNTTEWYRDNTQRNSEAAQLAALGTLDPITAAEMYTPDVEYRYFERDDFVKLRELSASYNLPSAWVTRFGASRASLMVTGRNLLTWAHADFRKSGLDPETKANRSAPWPGWQQTRSPIPHSIVTSMRVTF